MTRFWGNNYYSTYELVHGGFSGAFDFQRSGNYRSGKKINIFWITQRLVPL